MKTAKKIFSLLLVAVLMLSALPFQAFATGETKTNEYYINFYNGSEMTSVKGTVNGTSVTIVPPANPTPAAGKKFDGWQVNGSIRSNWTFTTSEINIFADETDTVKKYALRAEAVFSDKHEHVFDNPIEVKAPTCTEGGYTVMGCSSTIGGACSEKKQVSPTSATGHNWGAWEVETAATHDQAGMEVRKCGACGEKDRRPLNQLTFTVTFYVDGSVYTTQQWLRYATVPTLPTPDEILNKDFMGWYTAPTGGTKLEPGSEWSGSCTTYYARYEDSVHDGQSKINVYFRLYSEGVAQGQARKLTSFQVADYTSLASALNGKKAEFANQLAGLVDLNMYEIADGYYVYNPSTGKETAMASDAKVNGDNSVLIKLVANKSARATVMVFVHSKVEAAATYTYTMAGYTTSDTVFKADVENLLKSKGKNYTINGMFSDNMWERKMAGYTTDPVSALSIEDDGLNGVLKIHVLAPKFSAGTSKAADKTNPATGDTAMIEVTAAVMLLSAAAVVTLTQLRKKKMI